MARRRCAGITGGTLPFLPAPELLMDAVDAIMKAHDRETTERS